MAKLMHLKPKDFGLGKTTTKRRLAKIAAVVQAEWRKEIRNNLYSTRKAYLNSLTTEYPAPGTVSVGISNTSEQGVIALIAEQGMGGGGIGTSTPYDARTFILKPGSRKVKRDKRGMAYVDVPFQWRLGSKKASPGVQTMWAAEYFRSGSRAAAKRLMPWQRLGKGYAPSYADHHTTDIMHGMKRSPHISGKGSSYTTFRRATWNSAHPEIWRVAGIVGKNLAAKVTTKLPQIIKDSAK